MEVYGYRIPVEESPKVKVTFGNLTVNGKPQKVKEATAFYPKDVPDHTEAMAVDGKVIVDVGTPVEGRQQRQVVLMGE